MLKTESVFFQRCVFCNKFIDTFASQTAKDCEDITEPQIYVSQGEMVKGEATKGTKPEFSSKRQILLTWAQNIYFYFLHSLIYVV